MLRLAFNDGNVNAKVVVSTIDSAIKRFRLDGNRFIAHGVDGTEYNICGYKALTFTYPYLQLIVDCIHKIMNTVKSAAQLDSWADVLTALREARNVLGHSINLKTRLRNHLRLIPTGINPECGHPNPENWQPPQSHSALSTCPASIVC